MHCAYCRQPLGYVHGHAACLQGACPMFGQNQAECCSGEHGDCPATSTIGVAPLMAAEVVERRGGRPDR